MRILYAIQGTGNGHLSRARDIIPALHAKGQVDILVSGIEADVTLPYPVKYRLKGLSFIFGKKGGVDLWQTWRKSDMRQLMKDIRSVPVENYDLIINDFEPVSAWACFSKRRPCISLSHQSAVLHKKAARPKKNDPLGRFILKNYAPVSAKYGFHFNSYDDQVFTPVIRKEIRELKPGNEGHFTVYLPSYSDRKIIRVLSRFYGIRWEVFSKHCQSSFTEGNISVRPVNNTEFIKSMNMAEGVLCGAGFETPAEALFLRKKLLVIPMHHQYEQQCNAETLRRMGVKVMPSLSHKNSDIIGDWILSGQKVDVHYPDLTDNIINKIISNHCSAELKYEQPSIPFFLRLAPSLF